MLDERVTLLNFYSYCINQFLFSFQTISILWTLLKLQPITEIKLAILRLLTSLATKNMSPSSEVRFLTVGIHSFDTKLLLFKSCRYFHLFFQQARTLSTVTVIFSTLLQARCCVVHHEALQAFAQFAENTSHECIVTDSLNSSTKLQDIVSDYFNQVKKVLSINSMYSDESRAA